MAYASIGTILRTKLKADTALIADVVARFYPRVLPQNVILPAVIYKVLADVPSDTIDGLAGLFRAVVQYDVRATTAVVAERIEDNIRLSLQGYRGTISNVKVKGIHVLHGMDDIEEEVADYRRIIRFGVWYDRENPDHEEDDS